MSEKYFVDEKAIKTILKFLLIGSIGFILFITPLLNKTVNDEYCSIENTNEITNSYINSSIILNGTNTYFLQTNNNLDEQETYIQKTSYCFQAINTGSDPLEINIINEDQKVLATGYFSTGTNTECYEIRNHEAITGVKMCRLQRNKQTFILRKRCKRNKSYKP